MAKAEHGEPVKPLGGEGARPPNGRCDVSRRTAYMWSRMLVGYLSIIVQVWAHVEIQHGAPLPQVNQFDNSSCDFT